MKSRYSELVALYKNLKTIGGILPPVVSAANNYVHQVIPISPLLRLFATLLTFVSCVVATGWALSFVGSATLPADSKRIRRRAIIFWVLGAASFGLYFIVLVLMEEHPCV